MHLGRARRWMFLILTIALLAVVPVGASAQTQADVDTAARNKAVAEARQSEAYQEYQRISTRLDDAVLAY